jgi:hypothetical protein
MATKIVTKNSSTASAVPTASDLVQGELAVNVADKRLFTEDNGGSIVELGTNPSTIDINAGTIDGTTIGASSASTGAFTTLTATGAFTSRGIDDNADATAITIDSSENVGINNSSPAEMLTIGSTSDTNVRVQFLSSTTGGNTIQFGDGTGAGAYAGYINYTHSDNALAFATGSSERMRIDGSGRLGLGVTPEAWSSVFKVLRVGTGSSIAGESGGTSTWFNTNAYYDGSWKRINTNTAAQIAHTSDGKQEFKVAASGSAGSAISWNTAMTVDNSGNLLVGKTNTTFGSTGVENRADGRITSTRSGNTNLLLNRLSSDGSLIDFYKDGAIVGSIGTGYGVVDIKGGTSGLLMGNTAVLPVNGSGTLTTDSYDIGGSSFRFKDLYLSGAITAGGGISATPLVMSLATNNSNCDVTMQSANSSSVTRLRNGTNDFQVHTNGAERMRITSSGVALFGTTSENGTEGITINGHSSNTPYILLNTGASASTHVYFRYNSGTVGTITTTATSTSYNTSSDQRLKENIADADDAGSKVDAIQVRQFDWKADGSHQDYGMIAQELQAVAPEAVSVPEDSEEMMGVDYSKLVPMLIKEIQSLRNRVAQLEE